ncbi:MAG: zinc transporter ZupT [Clostridiales bacterium]|nr:zinc transporter ZupT [Clostridiales bacterium]
MLDSKILFPFILALFSGLSTVLGGLLVFFTKNNNNKIISFSLGFSAGVMITISLTDLFPEASSTLIKHNGNLKGMLLSLLFLIIGIAIAYLIDSFIPDTTGNTTLNSNNSAVIYKVGLVSMIALILHNFPEGIATFISGYHDKSLGIYVALSISLHNIPEGIAIAIPIYYGTNSRLLAIKYTLYSALAEPFGALIAFLFLRPYINDVILSITFALVAGIMLYISLEELLPEARKNGDKFTYIFSIVLGICIMPLSHVFFLN